MIRHGLLSQQDAERISETMQRTEDNKRRLDSLQPMEVLIIPAKITGGVNGAHAWTRQRIDATGGRYDDPITFTGQVSGVSSMTATWQPARLPGTTAVLSTFPAYGYVTPIGLTPSTGPNFEILVVKGGDSGGGRIVRATSLAGTSVLAGTTTAYSGNHTNISVTTGKKYLVFGTARALISTFAVGLRHTLNVSTDGGAPDFVDPATYENENSGSGALLAKDTISLVSTVEVNDATTTFISIGYQAVNIDAFNFSGIIHWNFDLYEVG